MVTTKVIWTEKEWSSERLSLSFHHDEEQQTKNTAITTKEQWNVEKFNLWVKVCYKLE